MVGELLLWCARVFIVNVSVAVAFVMEEAGVSESPEHKLLFRDTSRTDLEIRTGGERASGLEFIARDARGHLLGQVSRAVRINWNSKARTPCSQHFYLINLELKVRI